MRVYRGWGFGLLAALAALPLWLGAARAAESQPDNGPLISPDEMLSVDQVRPGMKGYGKSVFEGTRIERFNVTVVGVLKKIDFGGDMVLIRIDDGYPVTSGSGVSAGMSGSPIYVNDKLIGALAFAWPFAKDPVAGVTPIAQMLDNYRPGSAPAAPSVARAGDLQPDGGPLKLDGKLFARATVVPDKGLAPVSSTGTMYLTPVATPLMVSGMGGPGIDALKTRFGRWGAMVMPGPGKTDLADAEKPKIEPGAAVGVQLMGGDVDATAIGTVTYVKGNQIVAFGHPMFGLGSIDMPMTTAYIHGIISSQQVSFKMGSPIDPVGHITQDRNWSIGGTLGAPSPMVQAEFVVTDTDRGVRRDYHVTSAVHRDMTPSLLYGSLMNAVNSVSPPQSGTTRGTLEVWAKGMPVIKRDNIFAVGDRKSQIEQLFGDPMAGMPLAELLQILDLLENNKFGSVPVERLKVTVEVSEKRRTATIERAYADRKQVKPGDTVKIGVVIRPTDGPKENREFEVRIPRNIPGGPMLVGVAGGGSADRIRQYLSVTKPAAKTLQQQVSQITDNEQNSDLTIEMAEPVVGVAVSGREFPNLPNVVVEVLTGAAPSGVRMTRSHEKETFSTPWVLSGGQLLTLQVDSDEKDKSGPALTPGIGGFGGFSSILDLFRMGLGGDTGTEFGGDDNNLGLGGDGDGDDTDAFGIHGVPAAARAGARRPLAKDLPDQPAMPSFDELQQILEGGEDLSLDNGSSQGGSVTSVRKGVGRGPGVWRMGSAKEFAGGKLDGVLVSSRGELALAPKAESLLSSPERFFWAQTADSSGNVYVGGWLDGSIMKIEPGGSSSTFFDASGEVAISALTSDGSGSLYAAAEPSGTIYRIDGSGHGTAFAHLPEHRVWALKRVGDVLYAGTGSDGELYRITGDGRATLVFTAPDRHVFALAEDGQGGLYCATYPRGKIFRIRGEKAEPLFELPNAAVTALASDGKGNLYIGTSPKASVVKLTPSGDAQVIFQSKEKHVFSLLVDDSGTVTAAVGKPAKVYRIAPDRSVSTLWEPQGAAYVLSLSRDGTGNLYATTAGPTQIVRLGAKPASTGTYTSAVLNAGNLARWGAVRWTGSADAVQIQTRTGNTGYPDATWSEWSAAYGKADGQPISSPAGQYLQYRVLLSARGDAPTALRNIELFYRARNRAPEVTLKSPDAGQVLSGTRMIRWSAKDPDGDRLKYDLYYAREGTENWIKIGSRSGAGANEEIDETDSARVPSPGPAHLAAQPGARRITARATAPLPRVAVSAGAVGKVGVRGVPVQVGPEVTVSAGAAADASVTPDAAAADAVSDAIADELGGGGGALTWNTKKVPDGRYRLKVVASDALTSPDEPATGDAVSELVRVDNTAPKILLLKAKRLGPAAPTEVPVTDAGTYVGSAEYRVDGGEWIAAAAADGIFDSAQESVRIDPAQLKPGHHELEIRVRDAAGNEAAAKLKYLTGKLPASTR